MATSTLHGLGPVTIGTTAIGGITAQDTGVDSQFISEASSGELITRIRAIAAQKPTCSFTTTDLATVLAKCGSLGCSLASNVTTLFSRKYSDAGARDTTGHVSFAYQHGLLVPRTLSCQHQGDATISYEGVVTWDGTHDPMVISEAASPPALTTDARWTISAVSLGGVSIPQVKSINVNFGIQAASEGSDSDVWDTHPSISAVQPVISVTSSKISEIVDILGASGAVSIALRQRADGGTYGAATLTLAGSGLAVFKKPFGASGNRPGESTVECHLGYNGTVDPIVITVA